jgi:hypothetical protein
MAYLVLALLEVNTIFGGIGKYTHEEKRVKGLPADPRKVRVGVTAPRFSRALALRGDFSRGLSGEPLLSHIHNTYLLRKAPKTWSLVLFI